MTKTLLGWNPFFETCFREFETHYQPARIIAGYQNRYRITGEQGESLATVSGKLRFECQSPIDYPVVGDWVAIDPEASQAVIHAVLPRKTIFVRQSAGIKTDPQPIAANIDTVFIMLALGSDIHQKRQDFNLPRLERYLTLSWESGARPVIVMNKTDLCLDVKVAIQEVETVAQGTPIHAISCQSGQGLEVLTQYLQTGETIALLGSSGIGKSTLINCLIGETAMNTQQVRKGDAKGKHTTTHRHLFLLPTGGLILDSPGMREVQLWDAEEGIASAFEDIKNLAYCCKFRDCQHRQEPGCAIQQAIEAGELSARRLKNYQKLQREHISFETRQAQKNIYLAQKNHEYRKDRSRKLQRKRRRKTQKTEKFMERLREAP